MRTHYSVNSALAIMTAVWAAAACSAAEDPFTSGPAHATVTGLVTAGDGTPIRAATVRIACAGLDAPVVAASDSTGRYLANLTTVSEAFDGNSGRLPCHFTEPAPGTARVQRDTALGFVRGPVLVALQFVDLHEP